MAIFIPRRFLELAILTRMHIPFRFFYFPVTDLWRNVTWILPFTWRDTAAISPCEKSQATRKSESLISPAPLALYPKSRARLWSPAEQSTLRTAELRRRFTRWRAAVRHDGRRGANHTNLRSYPLGSRIYLRWITLATNRINTSTSRHGGKSKRGWVRRRGRGRGRERKRERERYREDGLE